ncbi:MAG: aspartate-semialdehyde dehydrogenase [Gammaproteobacteria bacterium]|jgi:aspartate-semialdehyde dehydrogenase|nr:aspartate-semialdehyde dehydrogenase [Gammaproteobacteria bacterium]MBT4493290.1 aspartate-semialdehyde dehydrogenase [Gammaproteobacteria bacterium]MBT7370355.1 aspartate-semialdehyde dehydrogenase [Gammaproteobacteria bacterium]
MSEYDVAIVGATGAVGEVMREILEEREFPVRNLHLLASERSAGSRLQFRGKSITVEDLSTFDFSQTQIGLFSAGGSISAEFAPKAAEQGCVVIDNTSHFRRDPAIPLIVPEVNGHRIGDFGDRRIIANPNCSTIQMLVALKPIYDAVGITRVNVATYQAVSGAGKRAIESLATQTAKLLNAQPIDNDVFPQQIAFNALPCIGDFQENGYTDEEMKMVWETQKIFEDDDILVNPTCVRIPVFYGHSEAVHIETREPISAEKAKDLLASAAGVEVIDETADPDFPTPVRDAAGTDPVFVGRIREDITSKRGLNLWIVSDNVRKGAALNSIQIAEVLLKHLQ